VVWDHGARWRATAQSYLGRTEWSRISLQDEKRETSKWDAVLTSTLTKTERGKLDHGCLISTRPETGVVIGDDKDTRQVLYE
jgi:hypothetical protein